MKMVVQDGTIYTNLDGVGTPNDRFLIATTVVDCETCERTVDAVMVPDKIIHSVEELEAHIAYTKNSLEAMKEIKELWENGVEFGDDDK